ncbi:MAG: hypothetical protein M3Q66_01185 [Chloroflexota bacterium]|nr:hypothetical protein [Chloroflexota bacterium]
MDQRELIARAARGDHEAFDALARFASNRLYGIAYRILRDQYLAESDWEGESVESIRRRIEAGPPRPAEE